MTASEMVRRAWSSADFHITSPNTPQQTVEALTRVVGDRGYHHPDSRFYVFAGRVRCGVGQCVVDAGVPLVWLEGWSLGHLGYTPATYLAQTLGLSREVGLVLQAFQDVEFADGTWAEALTAARLCAASLTVRAA